VSVVACLSDLKHTISEALVLEPHDSVVLWVDVCGFTSMAEKMTPQQLSTTMSRCFSVLVDSVSKHGGDVLKFCGDALLCEFRDIQGNFELKEGMDAALISACICAVEIQNEKTSSEINMEGGLDIKLKVSIAMGTAHALLGGGLHDRWEYFLMGEPLQQIRIADQLCTPGGIIMGDSAAIRLMQLLPDCDLQSNSTTKPMSRLHNTRPSSITIDIPQSLSVLEDSDSSGGKVLRQLHRTRSTTTGLEPNTAPERAEKMPRRRVTSPSQLLVASQSEETQNSFEITPSSTSSENELSTAEDLKEFKLSSEGQGRSMRAASLGQQRRERMRSTRSKTETKLPRWQSLSVQDRISSHALFNDVTITIPQKGIENLERDKPFHRYFMLLKLGSLKGAPVLKEIISVPQQHGDLINPLSYFVPMEALSQKFLYRTHISTNPLFFYDSVGDVKDVSVSFIKIQSITESMFLNSVLENKLYSKFISAREQGAMFSNAIHECLNVINSSLFQHGGLLRQMLCDDKGTVAICVFGLLGTRSKEVDASLAIVSALEIKHQLKSRYNHDACVGVASGLAYCGVIGNQKRAEFVVLGDTVNTAARIMAFADKGDHGVVCSQTAWEQSFKSRLLRYIPGAAETIAMKNKVQRQMVYFPNMRDDALTLHPSIHCLLSSFSNLLQSLSSMQFFCRNESKSDCLFVAGNKGMGKSAVCEYLRYQAFINNMSNRCLMIQGNQFRTDIDTEQKEDENESLLFAFLINMFKQIFGDSKKAASSIIKTIESRLECAIPYMQYLTLLFHSSSNDILTSQRRLVHKLETAEAATGNEAVIPELAMALIRLAYEGDASLLLLVDDLDQLDESILNWLRMLTNEPCNNFSNVKNGDNVVNNRLFGTNTRKLHISLVSTFSPDFCSEAENLFPSSSVITLCPLSKASSRLFLTHELHTLGCQDTATEVLDYAIGVSMGIPFLIKEMASWIRRSSYFEQYLVKKGDLPFSVLKWRKQIKTNLLVPSKLQNTSSEYSTKSMMEPLRLEVEHVGGLLTSITQSDSLNIRTKLNEESVDIFRSNPLGKSISESDEEFKNNAFSSKVSYLEYTETLQ